MVSFLLILKKIGLFFKNYGILIGLFLALVASIVFSFKKQNAYNKLLKEILERNNQHRRELDDLQKIHDEEVRRYGEIEKVYNETLEKIKNEHSELLSQLDSQKKSELKKIIESTGDNPDLMADRINNLFSIPIYHTNPSQ